MAKCQYCQGPEIAWSQRSDKKWTACIAQVDATGAVIRAPKSEGKRTVMRPVPDPGRTHYPHAHYGPQAAQQTADECPVWTPMVAKASLKARGFAHRPVPKGWTPGPPAGAPAQAPLPMTGAALTGSSFGPEDEPEPFEPPPMVAPVTEILPSDEVMAQWTRAEAAIRCPIIPTRVFLWGMPGTGKTELPWRIAQKLGWEHVYQVMTEDTPATDLLGHPIISGGNTVWCDGSLGRAIRASLKGHTVYVVDEIGRASADALSACLLAMTNPESLRLTLRTGEVITPDPAHWHVVTTSNDEPRMLPTAIQDRLHIAVNITGPHPDLVRSLTTVEAKRLAVSQAREYSIRALITYDRLRAGGMGLEDAAGIVWEPTIARSFADAVKLEARQ